MEMNDTVVLKDEIELKKTKPELPKISDIPKGNPVKDDTIRVANFEYVLAIPKTFEMKTIKKETANGIKNEVVMVPQDWQSGVVFFVNGVRKFFRELRITLDDTIEKDAFNRPMHNFPKVEING